MTFNSVHAFKEDFIENIDMHEAKSAYLMTPNVFLELTKNYNKTGVYLKEHFDVFSMPYGFAVPQGSFFVDLLDNTMQWLVTAGIPQHLMEFHRWMFMRPVDDEESGPVVLTVEILSHGFVLWLVSLGVSTVVFVYEISMYELKRWVFESLGNLMVLEHVMLVLEKHIF